MSWCLEAHNERGFDFDSMSYFHMHGLGFWSTLVNPGECVQLGDGVMLSWVAGIGRYLECFSPHVLFFLKIFKIN